jgi:acetyltransferase EpsM
VSPARAASRIIVIGGGEHARVVIEAIRADAAGHALVGLVDPQECEETCRRLAVARLGGEEALGREAAAHGVLGFGAIDTLDLRIETVRRLTPRLTGWAVVIHGAAWVSPTAQVGEGTVIMAGAVVQTGARIGAHCVVNSGAIVEHDVTLGDHVQLAPGVTLGGGVRIGARAYVGLGATVRDHLVVGARATVGMGAVVVRDVAEGVRVMGVPAQ